MQSGIHARRHMEIEAPPFPFPRYAKAPINGAFAFQMVRTERLELSHLAAPEPKSGVSTNFTTSANF